LTYETDRLAKIRHAGYFVESLDCILEQHYDLAVPFSEFAKSLSLLLKRRGDGLNRVAVVESNSERMLIEVDPGLFFILL
jgi:hypothetical protein